MEYTVILKSVPNLFFFWIFPAVVYTKAVEFSTIFYGNVQLLYIRTVFQQRAVELNTLLFALFQ